MDGGCGGVGQSYVGRRPDSVPYRSGTAGSRSVPLADLNNYNKIHTAILQMLNLRPKAYWHHLREIDFGPDHQPQAICQKIRAAGLHWLHPEACTKEQVIESVLVEHFTAILKFK